MNITFSKQLVATFHYTLVYFLSETVKTTPFGLSLLKVFSFTITTHAAMR
jgi:hypothetical protein